MVEATHHVLLIGIDAYPVKPLHGCVNDIDAVEKLLLGRAKIPPERITRLASPHASEPHTTALSSQPATLANIRAALARLASEEVGPDDRVLICYSGHGMRTPVIAPGGKLDRESLVPVDFNAGGGQFLFDFELNRLLAAIAKRTRNVSLILDCCHSAGATKILDLAAAPSSAPAPRSLDFALDLGGKEPLTLGADDAARAAASSRGLGGDLGDLGSVDDWQIVTACLNHELAQESTGDDGVRHGLLTRALMASLAEVPDAEIRSVPWARIWQRVRAEVTAKNPDQHPWMAGREARAVLGGPPVAGDTGYPLLAREGGTFAVGAGALAGVTEGAILGVYPQEPRFFPALDSDEDKHLRAGLLRVVSAEAAASEAAIEGGAFEVPAAARARLVVAGDEERLRVALAPRDGALEHAVAASGLLAVVDDAKAEARLVKRDDGRWDLRDDLHDARDGRPPLLTFDEALLPRARALLEHYLAYRRPLRMAERCRDLAGCLQVSLLATPRTQVRPEDAQSANFPQVGTKSGFGHALAEGDAFCVRVRNTSTERLRVTLLNCSGVGVVELMGDQEIDPRKQNVFWLEGVLGASFFASSGKAGPGIERLVAIGTTALDAELGHLTVDEPFSATIERLLADSAPRPFTRPASGGSLWTATQVIVGVGF